MNRDYFHQIEEMEKDFHETLEKYPIFEEMHKDFVEKELEEINDLIFKQDEFYYKKAIDKIERLINKIKNTSEEIKKNYEEFDRLSTNWNNLVLQNIKEQDLLNWNTKINKANELINSHSISDLAYANSIMRDLLKTVKYYKK